MKNRLVNLTFVMAITLLASFVGQEPFERIAVVAINAVIAI